MRAETETKKARSEAKDLLLEDYRYLSESFWKNEQAGETRVNLFIGIVTVVVGALVTLITRDNSLHGEPLRLVILASLFALLVLGLITLARLLTRNESTDRYKRGLDTIRQVFKDYFDGDGVLVQYYPIEVPRKEGRRGWWQHTRQNRLRKFGGLAHTIAGINSLLLAGLVGAVVSPMPVQDPSAGVLQPASLGPLYGSVTTAFFFGFVTQLIYVSFREKRATEELRSGEPTHAGGVVYKMENGAPRYLLARAKKDPSQWVFPKGHIEPGEGHGECALREVCEETGVVARVICPVGTVEFRTEKESINAKFYILETIAEGVSKERREIKWPALEEALELLTFAESKRLLLEGERNRVVFAATSAPV